MKSKFAAITVFFAFLFPLSVTTSAGPIIDGKEWLQPADLARFSWNDFNVICPSGSCNGQIGASGPVLNGYKWATVDDVNSLFNSYIGSPELSGPSAYIGIGETWGDAFFADFTDIFVGSSITRLDAWTSTASGPDEAYLGVMRYIPVFPASGANTDVSASKALSTRGVGAWLYRSVEPVSAPATLTLLLLGLVSLYGCLGQRSVRH